MSKKVLIISASPRKNGNSETLCNEFMRGAIEAGHDVEMLSLRVKKVGFCTACDYCVKHEGKCAIKDDMEEILDKIQASDVIVLSSPVYFFSVDAQMKAMIDRIYARWEDIPNKEFYYIMTALENDDHTMKGTIACFRGLLECMDNAKEMG